jgi:hypothetical protein
MHYVKQGDQRLSILFKLKMAWRSNPRDMKKIKKLQDRLHNIERYFKNDKKVNYKKKYGMFAWKAREVNSTKP